MRLAFILLFFATAAHGQIIINPYFFVEAGIAYFTNGKSIDIDGSSEYITIADSDDLTFTATNKITLTAWIRADVGTNFVILEKENEYKFETDGSGYLQGYIIDASTGGYKSWRLNDQVLASNWTHVAIVWNGSTITIYITATIRNKTDASSGSFSAMENTANPVRIGYNGTNYADGLIDQVALWDTTLTRAMIKEAMSSWDYNRHSESDNLIAWWSFDEDDIGSDNVTDLAGTNHGSTVSMESTDFVPYVEFPRDFQAISTAEYDSLSPYQYGFTDSIFGGFRWLNQTGGDYIDLQDADTFSYGDGSTDSPFSISMWYNARTNVAGSNPLFGKRGTTVSNNNGEYTMFLFGSRPAWRLYDASAEAYITRYPNVNLSTKRNDWVHYVGTYDGSSTAAGLKLYTNGEELGAAGDTTVGGTYVAMENLAHDLRIGATMGFTSSAYADAWMGDLIIFNKELSAAEVLAVYNNHEPRDETYESLSGNIAGYWRPYNGDLGTDNIIDQSGNGNHGTTVGYSETQYQWISPFYPRAILANAGSFDFDGSAEYVSVSDDNSLSFTNDSIFLAAYVYMDDATNFIIAEKEGEYLFQVNGSNLLEARFIDAEGDYIGRTYSSSLAGSEGNWIHLAATFDGTTVKLYLDGAQVDNTDANSGAYGGMTNTANNLTLFYDGSNYANGKASHVVIGNYPLHPKSIEELYNEGSPIVLSDCNFSANVTSAWRLDQTDDPTGTVTDIIGTNNGTATMMEAGDLKTTVLDYPHN